MKTTLSVIQNDADHAQAKALLEKLMNSRDPTDQARMVAQACQRCVTVSRFGSAAGIAGSPQANSNGHRRNSV